MGHNDTYEVTVNLSSILIENMGNMKKAEVNLVNNTIKWETKARHTLEHILNNDHIDMPFNLPKRFEEILLDYNNDKINKIEIENRLKKITSDMNTSREI